MSEFEPHSGPKRYRIGGIAKLCGFSVHAIRWYEAQGLIPNVGRDRGGRRVYEQGHVEHLAFIDHLRRTGMSVAELRKLTELGLQGWRTLPKRQAMLKAHRERVEREIEDLRDALDLIDRKMAYYAEWDAKKKRPPPLPHLPKKARPAR